MAFQGPPKRHEITYAELVERDRILDKNENEWLALDVTHDGHAGTVTAVAFWLADATGVRLHHLSKPVGDAVSVLRQATRDEALDEAEADIDAGPAMQADLWGDGAEEPVWRDDDEEPVSVVADIMGGEVIASETADHEAARNLARAGGEPLHLPPFSEFTDPEQRSHIFLVHGVYAHDVKTRKALATMHDDLHTHEAGKHTAHDHEGAFPA